MRWVRLSQTLPSLHLTYPFLPFLTLPLANTGIARCTEQLRGATVRVGERGPSLPSKWAPFVHSKAWQEWGVTGLQDTATDTEICTKYEGKLGEIRLSPSPRHLLLYFLFLSLLLPFSSSRLNREMHIFPELPTNREYCQGQAHIYSTL